jgi:hypothetical protein
MKKQNLSVLFTLVCIIFGLGLLARAEGEEAIVANVPYEFVIGTQQFPAGTYRAGGIDSPNGSRTLEIVSYETGATIFLNPSAFDDLKTEHTRFNFERAGDELFLSGIETPMGKYSIAVPRSAIATAQMKQQAPSSAGSN